MRVNPVCRHKMAPLTHTKYMQCVFFRAAWNASADWRGKSCLSVRLSVNRVHCDKTKERSVQIFIEYEDHLA